MIKEKEMIVIISNDLVSHEVGEYICCYVPADLSCLGVMGWINDGERLPPQMKCTLLIVL
jgi:hypothetical protein